MLEGCASTSFLDDGIIPLNDKSRDIYTLPKFSPQLSISSKETLPSLKEDLFPNLFIEKSAAAPLSSTHSVPQSIPRLPHPVYPAPEVLTMAQNRARAASLTENAERTSSSSRSPPGSDRLSSPLPSTPPTSPAPVSASAPIRQRSQSMDCIGRIPNTSEARPCGRSKPKRSIRHSDLVGPAKDDIVVAFQYTGVWDKSAKMNTPDIDGKPEHTPQSVKRKIINCAFLKAERLGCNSTERGRIFFMATSKYLSTPTREYFRSEFKPRPVLELQLVPPRPIPNAPITLPEAVRIVKSFDGAKEMDAYEELLRWVTGKSIEVSLYWNSDAHMPTGSQEILHSPDENLNQYSDAS